jgi:Phage tail tube protein
MPAGLGGGGSVGIALEATMGTYVAPTVFVPILDENFIYTESKYYSEQIRQTSIVSDVKSSYYHIEGPINMEVDPRFLPYFMYASRHTIAKTGAGPYDYTFTPSSAGSASTAASGAVPRTMSITVVRNGVVFGYTGCVIGSFEFTVEEGILRCSMDALGLAEAVQADPTETWVASDLLGADAHRIYLAASATTPTFTTNDVNFNGFTFRTNFNAEAQNRIQAQRSASYISFGITEAEIESELDFISRTDYDAMVGNSTRAIKLEATNGGATYAAATSAVILQGNRVSYDSYEPNLAGMGDLIMADFTGRIIGIAGGDAYMIKVKSPTSIT